MNWTRLYFDQNWIAFYGSIGPVIRFVCFCYFVSYRDVWYPYIVRVCRYKSSMCAVCISKCFTVLFRIGTSFGTLTIYMHTDVRNNVRRKFAVNGFSAVRTREIHRMWAQRKCNRKWTAKNKANMKIATAPVQWLKSLQTCISFQRASYNICASRTELCFPILIFCRFFVLCFVTLGTEILVT